jgi:glycosyltransferase involved in cell wall biosynthesis
MNILVAATHIPAKGKKGFQAVAFSRIGYLLQKGCRVNLVCYGDASKNSDLDDLILLEKMGVKVTLVKYRRLTALANLFSAMFHRNIPFQCAIYFSKEFKEVFTKQIELISPDFVYCIMARIALNIPDERHPLIVDLVDSLALNFSRRAKKSVGIKKFLLEKELGRIGRFENQLVARSRLSFVVSSLDQAAIGSKKVRVIPLGLDLNNDSEPRESPYDKIIVFTGNMNYQPNVEAAFWFVSKCWSSIKMEHPTASLVIAGANPTNGIRSLSRQDSAIVVTGRVPSLSAIIRGASVAIAPMQSGSGMQYKVLEAMSANVPVVATTIGLGGLKARPGRHILIGDSAEEFIVNVSSLLMNPSLNISIGSSGGEYVSNYHSASYMNKIFLDEVKAILN